MYRLTTIGHSQPWTMSKSISFWFMKTVCYDLYVSSCLLSHFLISHISFCSFVLFFSKISLCKDLSWRELIFHGKAMFIIHIDQLNRCTCTLSIKSNFKMRRKCTFWWLLMKIVGPLSISNEVFKSCQQSLGKNHIYFTI